MSDRWGNDYPTQSSSRGQPLWNARGKICGLLRVGSTNIYNSKGLESLVVYFKLTCFYDAYLTLKSDFIMIYTRLTALNTAQVSKQTSKEAG